MNSFLFTIASLFIAAFLALFFAPYVVDWNAYRHVFEAQATKIVGRQVSIDGEITLRFVPTPYVRLENVRISGATSDSVPSVTDGKDAASGRQRSPLLTIDAFTLWLAIPPLLRGEFEVQEMEATRPFLHLRIREDGTGNWQGLTPDVSSLPIPPDKVILENVRIRDGTISLVREGQPDVTLWVMEEVTGRLSAASLTGPYQFRGQLVEAETGQIRELRLSTSRLDKKSGLWLKAILRNLTTQTRFLLESYVWDLEGNPKVKGTLEAQVPWQVFVAKTTDAPSTAISPASSETKVLKKPTPPVEILASFTADSHGAQFANLLVKMVRDNRPQILKGDAKWMWSGGNMSLDVALQSRLLDLDLLTSGWDRWRPWENVVGLARSARSLVRRFTDARISLDLEQVTLGSDLIRNIRIGLRKEGQQLAFDHVSALLPGSNQVSLQGKITEDKTGIVVAGPLTLRGENLGRLTQWLFAPKSARRGVRPSPFSLMAEAKIHAQGFALRQARGDLAGMAFTGDFGFSEGAARTFSLRLESAELDLEALTGQRLSLRDALAALLPRKKAREGSVTLSPLAKMTGGADTRLDIQLGHVRLADFVATDLRAKLRVTPETLAISSLAFRADAGLQISASGRLDKLNDSPSGRIHMLLAGETVLSLQRLGEIVGISPLFLADERRLAVLAPLRLAVTISADPGSQNGTGLLLSADGAVGENRLSVTARLAEMAEIAVFSGLANRRLAISAALLGDDAEELIRAIFPSLSKTLPDFPLPRQTSGVDDQEKITEQGIWFTAFGVPSEGLQSRFAIRTSLLSATLSGDLAWREDGFAFSGDTVWEAENGAIVLALAGVDLRGMLPEAEKVGAVFALTGDLGGTLPWVPLRLSGKLEQKGWQFRLSEMSGQLGRAKIRGGGVVDIGQSPIRFDISAKADQTDLPALLSLLTADVTQHLGDRAIFRGEAGRQITVTKRTKASPAEEPWSNASFSFDWLEKLNGKLSLQAEALTLAPGLTLSDADLAFDLTKGTVTLSRLTGRLFQGRFSAEARLTQGLAAADVSGQISLSQGKLAALRRDPSAPVLAEGKFDLTAKFSGRGLSPLGLVSLMSGEGQLHIQEAKVPHFSPSVLQDVAAEVLSDMSDKTQPIPMRFRQNLQKGELIISERTVPFVIRDGVVRFDPVTLTTPQTTIKITTRLTLADLVLDSDWQLSPNPKSKMPELPAVSLRFSGPLHQWGRIKPVFRLQSYERFLTVLRMEQDVELLEKLNLGLEKRAPSLEPGQGSEAGRFGPTSGALPADRNSGDPEPKEDTFVLSPGDLPRKKPKSAQKPRPMTSQPWNPFLSILGQ